MERLGKVLHISPTTGNLIVKAKTVFQVGVKVFDNKLREVGVIFDVLGPVVSPYVAIKPSHSSPEKFVNQVLYLLEKKR
ncbi:MAG: Gar1/Naf1 family protein [Candidatus Bathyarchaeia archaeon]